MRANDVAVSETFCMPGANGAGVMGMIQVTACEDEFMDGRANDRELSVTFKLTVQSITTIVSFKMTIEACEIAGSRGTSVMFPFKTSTSKTDIDDGSATR